MSYLRKFFSYSPGLRWLLIWAHLWLAAARIGLWLLPFRAVLEHVEATPPSRSRSGSADQIVWAIEVASHHVPGTQSCLPRALATLALLRRAGIPGRLQLGLAKSTDGRTEAHAWVEVEGRVVMGAEELERFVPFAALREVHR